MSSGAYVSVANEVPYSLTLYDHRLLNVMAIVERSCYGS
jgi:hypothetical protein